MKPADMPTLFSVLLPFGFAVLWCGVCVFLSMVGGWRRLARAFPARRPPSGNRFRAQYCRVGLVNYNTCLTIYSSEVGLYFAVWPMFRAGHPPFFVPWASIHVKG